MNPKIITFTYIMLYLNIAFNLISATISWFIDDIALNTNPTFQTALLFVIAGLLFYLSFSKQYCNE
ncbi:hypothetical protein GCM10009114_07750 [Aliiglaciecola litoralis]|uniref:Uncharacterized protein n=1 Tax=Aliiglaciecola litoralis TaxID=582857 RepID=A0ABP3WTC9_9ALTE